MVIDRERARWLLQQSKTLDDAEESLGTLSPTPPVAARWGLFDGFYGRPKSLAGIVSDKTPQKTRRQKELDYNEGWEVGASLSVCELPA